MKDVRLPLRGLILLLGLLSGLLAALLFIPLAAGQAASQQSRPRTWHAAVGVESTDRAIQGMAFLPGDLWINVGDTVLWTVHSGEGHTVTFLQRGQTQPAFDVGDPMQMERQGSTHYDGVSYANSGVMSTYPDPPSPHTYRLIFDKRGDFTYICLVHHTERVRTMEKARIHVRAAGTPYPYTQQQYDRLVRQQTVSILRDGHALAQRATAEASNQQVILGIGDDRASVMGFFPQHIVIRVGETVTFTDRDSTNVDPHTVTYHSYGGDPSAVYGDPTHFDGTQPFSSGFLGQNAPDRVGTSFKVTFTKAGTYAFSCEISGHLGIKATVVVRR